jgi:hypothetical protein
VSERACWLILCFGPCMTNISSHSEETEDHILQCKTSPRRTLRKSWYTKIMNLDKKKIPIDIRKAICVGIKGWLEQSTSNQDDIISTFSNDIQQAFQHRSEIGWGHFARGRLSMTWGVLLNDIFDQQKFDAEAWGTKLVDINFEHLLLFWDQRCQSEHGTTIEEQEAKLKKKLLNEILHMQQTSYPRNDNDAKILHHDFNDISKLNCRQLQDWIVGAQIIYKICKKNIYNIPNFFTDATMCQNIDVDPG